METERNFVKPESYVISDNRIRWRCLKKNSLYTHIMYTGCLKIASTKKTVASGSPKKSKKPIFNFLKQKG
jgi:hypothetical protein